MRECCKGLRTGKIVRGMVLLLFLLLQGGTLAQQVNFTDVTQTMQAWGWRVTIDGGVRVSAFGHGVSFADVTGDSIPDLFISSAVRKADGKIPETLYIGQPGGAPYSEEDGKRGVSDSYGMTGTHGIALFDYDNDGDFDIYNATTDDWNRLYRNNGVGYFDTVTTAAGLYKNYVWVDTYGYLGYGTRGVVAFDADNDGFMDLLGVNWGPVETRKEVPWITPAQPNEYYHNNGDNTFTKRDDTGLTHPENPSHMGTQGVTAADVNNDGWMDIFICHRNYAYLGKTPAGSDSFGVGPIPTPNQLLINDGSGHFVDETQVRGLYDDGNDANGATFADFDNDGDLDLFVPPKDITVRKLKIYENDGRGYFTDVSSRIRIDQWGFSPILGDFNNDGYLDLFVSRSYGTSAIYLNTGAGNFSLQGVAGVETAAYDPRGGGLADIEGDGDLDIYYVDANKDMRARYSNRLFRNDTPRTNHWLKVTGRGPKGDAGGFGTKIWLFEAGAMDDMERLVGYRQVMNTYGYLCQDDPVQHFGLGSRTAVDVKVRFLDGTELSMAGVAADRKIIFTRPQQMILHSGDGQNGSSGQALAHPLQVKVTDSQGRPVRGAAVHWTALSGGGTFQPGVVTRTGADGIASVTCIPGSDGAQQQVEASSPDFAAAVLFNFTNTTPVRLSLDRISGSGQSGPPAAALPQPLVARVSTPDGGPAAQRQVLFKVILGGGQVNSADSVAVLSDADGMVRVTWRLGAQPGSAQQVKAWLADSPEWSLYFDAVTFGPAATLQWLSVNTFSGTVGKVLPDSLAAKIITGDGQPVANYPVDFSVTAGGGWVNGARQIRILTNSLGIARCQWRLGSGAGAANQTLVVTAGPLAGSPVTITASAAAGAPFRLSPVSGDGQGAAVNEPFGAPLVVAVSDTFGNPVTGQPVLFEVVQGAAYINYAATATVASGADGRAQALLRAGSSPGPVAVRAAASLGATALAGSPLTFSANVSALSFDPARSTLSATSPVVANNRDRSMITVRLRDANGQPVAGVQVTLFASGANNTLHQPPGPTDAQGEAAGALISTRTGVKKIWAVSEGRPVTADSATALFIAGPAARLDKLSGDDQTGLIGSPLPQPLVVALADSFENPLTGAAVTGVMLKPDGSSVELAPRLTDGEGRASFQPLFSPLQGLYTFRLRHGALPEVTFTAQAAILQPATLLKVSGDDQVALPGGALLLPLTVQVLSAGSQPIANVAVTWTFESGAGLFPGGATAVTGSDGKASVTARLGEDFGTYYITARAAGLDRSVTFTAMTRTARIKALETISGDGQSGRAGAALPLPLTVRVLDELDSPAAGVPVQFEVTSGGGVVIPNTARISSADGTASVSWILGESGTQSVRAWLAESPALQLQFGATLAANQAPALACPADTTIAEGSALSLYVAVHDPDGDPVRLTALDLPAGALLDTLTGVFSWHPGYDAAGLYRVTFVASDSYGASAAHSCLIRVADVRRPIQVLSFAPADTLVVMELYTLYTFEAVAIDPDGDSLRYQWEFNGMPVGSQPRLKVTANPAFPAHSRVSVRIYTLRSSTTISWTLDIQTGVEIAESGPDAFILGQNYPNPFNPTTHISFRAGRTAEVSVVIYNASGQLVRRLHDGLTAAGWHQAVWDARDEAGQPVPSGAYYCRMSSGPFQQIKKLLLLK